MTSRPGVYVFRNRFGQVIYVGKAKSLKRRLASYFQPARSRTADPKVRSLINSIETVEVFPVGTDEEATVLESRFIKEYSPRYNVLMRDDKRFLLVKVDVTARFPRLRLARLKKDDGAAYFGPFPNAGALREMVKVLTGEFGLRSCSPALPGQKEYEHCSADIVRFCCAPCIGRASAADYRERVDRLLAVLEGKTGEIAEQLAERMQAFAGRRDYERAARLRDVIDNLKACGRMRTFERASASNYPGEAGVLRLQEVLGLASAPVVVECFDISNIFGSNAVGSMVRFEGGKPARDQYRRFRIRTVDGIDDFAMMEEVVGRRYRRLREEGRALPDLVVIDGGKGQLHAAARVLEAIGLAELPVIGLAKRFEEVYTLGSERPILLERHDVALRLLQAIRDEAHRFAVAFHRELRRKRILNSLLDEIPGIGKKRRELLLKAFGSVRNLRRHTPEAVMERVPGIGEQLARQVIAYVTKQAEPLEDDGDVRTRGEDEPAA